MPIRKISLCILILRASCAGAQDLPSVIENFRKAYTGAEKLSLVIDIEVFEDSAAATPYFLEHASIKRDGKNYRYAMSSNELLMNERYLIVVNKVDKEILYGMRDLKSEQILEVTNLPVDTLLRKLGHSTLVRSEQERLHYRVSTKHSEIATIDLHLNTLLNHIEKIQYRYKDGQVVVINFSTFDVNPAFDESIFSEKNFLEFKNNTVTVPAHLKGYRALQNDSTAQ